MDVVIVLLLIEKDPPILLICLIVYTLGRFMGLPIDEYVRLQ